jgi:hypothetical protein
METWLFIVQDKESALYSGLGNLFWKTGYS